MRGVAAAVVLVFITLHPMRAQGNTPPCVAACIAAASQAAGCGSSSDWKCMCGISSFHSTANRCITGTCNPSDAQSGEDMISGQCNPNAITSFSVTNSETSPPQSGEPSVTRPRSITLVPPTPPPASPEPSHTVTSTPPATITATQPPVIGASSGFSSSFSSLTSDVGTSTEANVPASGSLTGTGSSGTQQPGATGTPGNGARTVGIRGWSLLPTLLGAVSVNVGAFL